MATASAQYEKGITDGFNVPSLQTDSNTKDILLGQKGVHVCVAAIGVLSVLTGFFSLPISCIHSPGLQWMLTVCSVIVFFYVGYYVYVMLVWDGGVEDIENDGTSVPLKLDGNQDNGYDPRDGYDDTNQPNWIQYNNSVNGPP